MHLQQLDVEEDSARVTRNDDSNCLWAILSKVSGIVGIGRGPLGRSGCYLYSYSLKVR